MQPKRPRVARPGLSQHGPAGRLVSTHACTGRDSQVDPSAVTIPLFQPTRPHGARRQRVSWLRDFGNVSTYAPAGQRLAAKNSGKLPGPSPHGVQMVRQWLPIALVGAVRGVRVKARRASALFFVVQWFFLPLGRWPQSFMDELSAGALWRLGVACRLRGFPLARLLLRPVTELCRNLACIASPPVPLTG